MHHINEANGVEARMTLSGGGACAFLANRERNDAGVTSALPGVATRVIQVRLPCRRLLGKPPRGHKLSRANRCP